MGIQVQPCCCKGRLLVWLEYPAAPCITNYQTTRDLFWVPRFGEVVDGYVAWYTLDAGWPYGSYLNDWTGNIYDYDVVILECPLGDPPFWTEIENRRWSGRLVVLNWGSSSMADDSYAPNACRTWWNAKNVPIKFIDVPYQFLNDGTPPIKGTIEPHHLNVNCHPDNEYYYGWAAGILNEAGQVISRRGSGEPEPYTQDGKPWLSSWYDGGVEFVVSAGGYPIWNTVNTNHGPPEFSNPHFTENVYQLPLPNA
jgi:hypothetical protein